MKKKYEKPELEIIEFSLNQPIMADNMPSIGEDLGDSNDGWE